MMYRKKNIKLLVTKVIIAFVLVALFEYLAVTILSSNPVVMMKVQGIIGVLIVAYLVHIARKIWVLYNIDHPMSRNGQSNL